MKVSTYFTPATEYQFKMGTYVKIDNAIYILAYVVSGAVLIDIATGNYWTQPVQINRQSNFTESDARAILSHKYDVAEFASKAEVIQFIQDKHA